MNRLDDPTPLALGGPSSLQVAAYLILLVFALLAWAVRLLFQRHLRAAWGWIGVANGVTCVAGNISQRPVLASVSAGAAAVALWLWWHYGGGDGPKRRLAEWRRTFQGVRRTAPVGGAT